MVSVAGIAHYVSLELGHPVLRSARRDAAFSAPGVLVPKATVYENHFFPRWKNKIRLAGKIMTMEPEAKSEAMGQRPDNHFRPSVFCPDRRHIGAALRLADFVHGISFPDECLVDKPVQALQMQRSTVLFERLCYQTRVEMNGRR